MVAELIVNFRPTKNGEKDCGDCAHNLQGRCAVTTIKPQEGKNCARFYGGRRPVPPEQHVELDF